jgi:hypothetical protein
MQDPVSRLCGIGLERAQGSARLGWFHYFRIGADEMGQAPPGPVNAKSAATLATVRKEITLARRIVSFEAQTKNGPKRSSYEEALRHIDLAIAEIDHKLAALNRGS